MYAVWRCATRQATTGRHPVEPRAYRRALLERGQSPPGSDQCVLHRVLGIFHRAEHPVAVHLHPWADRINSITKYVFSSTLLEAQWNNSVIVGGDVTTEVRDLKQRDGGDLLIYGPGLLAQPLLKSRLIDVLDLSIHPVIVGSGGLLFRGDIRAAMQLVAAKTFSKIVKLTYEPRYQPV